MSSKDVRGKNRMYKLSNQQEAILLAMMCAEREQKRGAVWVCTHFFFMALGIHWNSYYRRLMEDLCQLGWMERQFYGGQWWYMLTDTARVNRGMYWTYSSRGVRKHLRPFTPEQAELFEDFQHPSIDAGIEDYPLPGSDEYLDEEYPLQ